MTDADGILKERTDYSPYGVARQRPPADLNGDGKIDGVDQLILFNAWGASLGSGVYNPDADINFDGQVNGSDFLILSNNFGADPAPPGAVSQHGNTVGYSGYIYDDAIGMSLARFRWHDAETGRWATRDPIGYADGNNMYAYVSNSPYLWTDPFGLFSTSGDSNLIDTENPSSCDNGNSAARSRCIDNANDNYNNDMAVNESRKRLCYEREVNPKQRKINRIVNNPDRLKRFYDYAPQWGTRNPVEALEKAVPILGMTIKFGVRGTFLGTIILVLWDTGAWLYDVDSDALNDLFPGDARRVKDIQNSRDLSKRWCDQQYAHGKAKSLRDHIKAIDKCHKEP